MSKSKSKRKAPPLVKRHLLFPPEKTHFVLSNADLKRMYPSSRFVLDEDSWYVFWEEGKKNLPLIIEEKADVVILVPTMEVCKDRIGFGVPDHVVPSDISVLAVMVT